MVINHLLSGMILQVGILLLAYYNPPLNEGYGYYAYLAIVPLSLSDDLPHVSMLFASRAHSGDGSLANSTYPSSHNHGSGKWVPPILVSFHLGWLFTEPWLWEKGYIFSKSFWKTGIASWQSPWRCLRTHVSMLFASRTRTKLSWASREPARSRSQRTPNPPQSLERVPLAFSSRLAHDHWPPFVSCGCGCFGRSCLPHLQSLGAGATSPLDST